MDKTTALFLRGASAIVIIFGINYFVVPVITQILNYVPELSDRLNNRYAYKDKAEEACWEWSRKQKQIFLKTGVNTAGGWASSTCIEKNLNREFLGLMYDRSKLGLSYGEYAGDYKELCSTLNLPIKGNDCAKSIFDIKNFVVVKRFKW